MQFKKSGFTLIELLIVVAIIAILAAIAVPNFLEAQTRSKVSRAKADLRTVATAIEAYFVDHNKAPREYSSTQYGDAVVPPGTSTTGIVFPGRVNGTHIQAGLSTPIAYITTAWIFDPFVRQGDNLPTDEKTFTYHDLFAKQKFAPTSAYYNAALEHYGAWRMCSVGPDQSYFNSLTPGGPSPFSLAPTMEYDSTNGSISQGNIWRSQKNSDQKQPKTGPLLGAH